MGKRNPLANLTLRLPALLTRLARDPQIQNRLEVGSAIALGAGLLITVLFLLDTFAPLQSALSAILFEPSATQELVEQDRLVQIVIIFLLALLAGATLPHVRFLSAVALTIIYFVIYLAYAIRKFEEAVLVAPLYSALALILTLGGTMAVRFFTEERPRAFVDRLLRWHAAPEIVARVEYLVQKGKISLSGNQRVATVLWVDLRDFETLAEAMPPHELLEQINACAEQIMDAVFQREGMLLQKSGNAILAVWNLPLEQLDYAPRAARAALDIRARIRALARQKNIEFEVGVGLATDSVVAGNIGKKSQAEFGVVGQVVTLAERLSARGRRGIYLDEATRKRIANEFDTRESAPVRLRAKGESLAVWRMVETVELESREDQADDQ